MNTHLPKKGLVMVVDDEVDTLDILDGMLKALHYDTILVKNGKDVVNTYQRHKTRIDLVMLDIFIPQISGAEIYTALTDINPNIRVLVISGYSQESDEVQNLLSTLNKTGSDFIVKPFTLNTLNKKIHSLIYTEHA